VVDSAALDGRSSRERDSHQYTLLPARFWTLPRIKKGGLGKRITITSERTGTTKKNARLKRNGLKVRGNPGRDLKRRDFQKLKDPGPNRKVESGQKVTAAPIHERKAERAEVIKERKAEKTPQT